MPEIEFDSRRIFARKDFLMFVKENFDFDILEHLGDKPERWIEELAIIYGMLTEESLIACIDLDTPPTDSQEFQRLGDHSFVYRGKDNIALSGLWLSRHTKRYNEKFEKLPHTKWTHYKMGFTGSLMINKMFSEIPMESLLPENFEPKSELVRMNRRPVFVFTVPSGFGDLTIYAKGASYQFSYYTTKPSWRLTNVTRIYKNSSEDEMNKFLRIAELGAKVPDIVGYYKTPAEEFLFLNKVDGKTPAEYLNTSRKDIIVQDASLLATLCLAGYRKCGFTDYDDKLFDGKYLYLIDVDECADIYPKSVINDVAKRVLLDPSTNTLEEIKSKQRSVLEGELKDVIFKYMESSNPLLPSREDRELYIKVFYEKMGLDAPSGQKIDQLLNFPKNYITMDRAVSLLSDV